MVGTHASVRPTIMHEVRKLRIKWMNPEQMFRGVTNIYQAGTIWGGRAEALALFQLVTSQLCA